MKRTEKEGLIAQGQIILMKDNVAYFKYYKFNRPAKIGYEVIQTNLLDSKLLIIICIAIQLNEKQIWTLRLNAINKTGGCSTHMGSKCEVSRNLSDIKFVRGHRSWIHTEGLYKSF